MSGERSRLEGYRGIVENLSRTRALRAEHDVASATDVLFVLLGPDTFRAFTQGRGWPVDRWRAWVAGSIERELFVPARRRTGTTGDVRAGG